MADDQKEARAVQLASEALKLVAAGDDEVRICLQKVDYTCSLGVGRMAPELYEKQLPLLRTTFMSRLPSIKYSQETYNIAYRTFAANLSQSTTKVQARKLSAISTDRQRYLEMWPRNVWTWSRGRKYPRMEKYKME